MVSRNNEHPTQPSPSAARTVDRTESDARSSRLNKEGVRGEGNYEAALCERLHDLAGDSGGACGSAEVGRRAAGDAGRRTGGQTAGEGRRSGAEKGVARFGDRWRAWKGCRAEARMTAIS